MKIFAAHDGGSGCALAYYRMIVPLTELGRHDGFEVTFASGLQEDRLGRKSGVHLKDMEGFDLVVGQRFNSPAGLQVWRRAGAPLSAPPWLRRRVYETDDDVFTITMENFAAYSLYKREDIQDAVTHCMETADLVTVTTPYLAQAMGTAAREHGGDPDIRVLPNYVPEFVLDLERERRERPCIGWCGGASHGRDVHLMIPSARRFLKRFPGWDFRFAGTDYRPSLKVAEDRASYAGWAHVTDDPEKFYGSLDFDIGLAPLLETEFARSKSFVKILEYAAMGIPFIASDCEPYRLFTVHGENGFLAKRDHEWLKYMGELASDDALRMKMGENAREAAKAWTIEGNWRLWADAYRSLWKGGPP